MNLFLGCKLLLEVISQNDETINKLLGRGPDLCWWQNKALEKKNEMTNCNMRNI